MSCRCARLAPWVLSHSLPVPHFTHQFNITVLALVFFTKVWCAVAKKRTKYRTKYRCDARPRSIARSSWPLSLGAQHSLRCRRVANFGQRWCGQPRAPRSTGLQHRFDQPCRQVCPFQRAWCHTSQEELFDVSRQIPTAIHMRRMLCRGTVWVVNFKADRPGLSDNARL